MGELGERDCDECSSCFYWSIGCMDPLCVEKRDAVGAPQRDVVDGVSAGCDGCAMRCDWGEQGRWQ